MNTKYQILFGIEEIGIQNTNSTIWSDYSNTEYLIPNHIQNFEKKQLKSTYLSHTRHFV